jgi:hypothetical protein
MRNGTDLTNSEAKQTMMRKLTKKQIQEGLELIPMDRILLGTGTDIKLTAKQKRFAEELAKGETKVGAYRKAYNTKARPAIQATSASRLASKPHIQLLAERIGLALEAAKYQTPAHIRALTIHELTRHAISEDTAPAQRIKALELLGKITEVALFTERRETVVTTDSGDARAKLMNAMRLAITNSQAIDAEYSSADDLLAELAGGEVNDDDQPDHERAEAYTVQDTEPSDSVMLDTDTDTQTDTTSEPEPEQDTEPEPELTTPKAEGTGKAKQATPPTTQPQKSDEPAQLPMHSIPHNESPTNSQHNSAILEGVVSENTGFDQK